jgi:hypothetical protein
MVTAPFVLAVVFFVGLAVFVRPFYKEDFPYFGDWPTDSTTRPLTLSEVEWKEVKFI